MDSAEFAGILRRLLDSGENGGGVMRDHSNKLDIGDDRWQVAVAREAIIRPLVDAGQLSPDDVATVCRILGLRRSRLYVLIEQYRSAPVTSSLAAATPGPKKGSRRLSVEAESLIEEAVHEKYLTRQKASVSKLHDYIRHLCRARHWPLHRTHHREQSSTEAQHSSRELSYRQSSRVARGSETHCPAQLLANGRDRVMDLGAST